MVGKCREGKEVCSGEVHCQELAVNASSKQARWSFGAASALPRSPRDRPHWGIVSPDLVLRGYISDYNES